jgi:hypothetical protein
MLLFDSIGPIDYEEVGKFLFLFSMSLVVILIVISIVLLNAFKRGD